MKNYPRFTTKRLEIRPFKFADAPVIQRLVSQPEVLKSLSRLPQPYTLADAEDWIATHPFLFAQTGEVHMALCLKSPDSFPEKTGNNPAAATKPGGGLEDTLMGAMGLMPGESGWGEIGFWLGKAHQGKGYAQEALAPVLQYGFGILKLKTIFAEVIKGNTGSRRLLEKAGFHLDPDFRNTDTGETEETIRYILQTRDNH